MIDRRNFLGSLALLPFLMRALANAPRRRPRALILVWLDGGMSHLDSFDCKPEASPEIRGDLASKRANVDGVFVSAHLPGVAARLDRCALLRSVTHGEGNHDRGSHLLLTGHRPSPVLVHPALGAVFGHDEGAVLPPYVAIPRAVDYAGPGSCRVAAAVRGRRSGPRGLRGARPRRRSRALRERARAAQALDALDGAPRRRSATRPFRRDCEAAVRGPRGAVCVRPRGRAGRRAAALRTAPPGQSCLLARQLSPQECARCCQRHGLGPPHGIKTALTTAFHKTPGADEALSALLDDLRERQLDDWCSCASPASSGARRDSIRSAAATTGRARRALPLRAGIRPAVVS